VAQLALALAIPLIVYAIGKELYDQRVALLAMALASVYMPLFEYSGYLLAENPFTFLLLLAFALLARSLRAATGARAAFSYGLAAGLCLGLAVSFKSAALSAAVLVVLVIVGRMRWGGLAAWRPLAAAAVGLMLVTVPLAIRATRLNEGRFCLVANEASRGVLLGHHGDVYLAKFYDRKRGLFYEYGYSTAIERGRTGVVEINVGPWDNKQVVAEAWRWTKEHPRESLALGFEHVFDLFISMPWPSGSDGMLKTWALYTQRAYQPLLLLPAALALVFLAWRARARGPGVGADLMVLAPIAGIAASAFLAVGEARYRAPFDGFLILLAARGYLATWDGVTSRIQSRRPRRPPPSPPSPAPSHPDSSP
jgi:4-amino-4-deoxy-L-arabinose transferase-like glycosyltransferase